MARIWSSGAEFDSGMSIHLIGGIRDGDVISLETPTPEIYFNVMDGPNMLAYIEEGDDGKILVPKVVKYKRVADTLNYVCVNWYP